MTAAVTIAAVVADVVRRLADDPELRAMAEANDQEHFELGCRSPRFRAKVAAAFAAVRVEGVSPNVAAVAVEMFEAVGA